MSDGVQRRRGFDSPSLVEQSGDPVFPWITRRALGYWVEDEKLDLRLQRLSGHYHDLIRYWGYSPLHCKTTVFEGFKTDFGSVPRLVWSIVAPTDIRRPAILHDAHYRDAKILAMREWLSPQECRRYRKLFDLILRESMKYTEPRIPGWKRWIIYRAVRIGGRI